MPWSNNCYKLPRIADYAAAKKRFDGTAQPRAVFWSTFQRPLDGAGAHHKRIQFNPSNQAYELVLYRAPLVTYYPDGTVAVRPDSRKMSRDFLYATLPLGLSVMSVHPNGFVLGSISTDCGGGQAIWVDIWVDGSMLRPAGLSCR